MSELKTAKQAYTTPELQNIAAGHGQWTMVLCQNCIKQQEQYAPSNASVTCDGSCAVWKTYK